jgi:hypothetical protein
MVYRQEDDILAYAEIIHGPQGIYLQPVVHPAVKDLDNVLASLVAQQPGTPARPIYLAARSYQAWLESPLYRLNAQVTPRQALLVKHLAVTQRAGLLIRHPVTEKYKPEATVPMVQHSQIYKN